MGRAAEARSAIKRKEKSEEIGQTDTHTHRTKDLVYLCLHFSPPSIRQGSKATQVALYNGPSCLRKTHDCPQQQHTGKSNVNRADSLWSGEIWAEKDCTPTHTLLHSHSLCVSYKNGSDHGGFLAVETIESTDAHSQTASTLLCEK